MIIEGKAKDPEKRYIVVVNKDGFDMVECPELKGLRTYAASEKLAEKYGEKAVFVLCGPAGEKGLCGASVALTDEGATHPARHAARGGLGAAIGIKGLKAVAVDDSGTKPRQPKDMAAFKEYLKTFTKAYKEGGNLFEFGTSTTVPLANMLNTFPTRNRREMQFEHADKLDGNNLVQNFETRGGGMHHCMTGCIVSCSNVVHNADGEYVTSALEFETISLCGSNCMIGDLDKVALMDRLCDELGLDTIETGGAIGLAMDCGALEFGDADGAIALIEKIDKGDQLAEDDRQRRRRGRQALQGRSDSRHRRPGPTGVGAAHASGHRADLHDQRHGRRPHRGADRSPPPRIRRWARRTLSSSTRCATRAASANSSARGSKTSAACTTRCTLPT